MMMLIAVTVVPTMACEPGSSCANGKVGNVDTSKMNLGDPIELIGPEKEKLTNTVISNEGLKN